MLQVDKVKAIESIKSEAELRTELVIPLLKKMRQFSDVLDNQSSDEAGVDVIGVSSSPFKKPEYTAVVLKLGNITQKVSDQKTGLLNIIENQIRLAIKHPLTHPRLPTQNAFASRVIVITNGTISRNAESTLQRVFTESADINLDFIGNDRLIDQIDELWPRFYEDRRPFLSSYAKRLHDTLNVIDLENLGYVHKQRSLSDIYIDTLLYEQDSIAKHELSLEKTPIQGQQLCKQLNQLIVVTSGPGGGKSTLLKEIAISQSKEDKNRVAVYLQARDILDSSDLVVTAANTLSQYSGDPEEIVAKEIRLSKLLLLVDGLDELGQLADREAVIQILKKAQVEIDARVILGSRPETNPKILAALSEFKSYSISPLRLGQIRSFFGKWFKQDLDRATSLIDALKDKGVFEKLPKTPMTMTLVAIVYESKQDLPSTLTELYQMFIDLLIGKWDANRKVASPYDSQIKVAFLTKLAWTMQAERLEIISQDRCLQLAREFFENQATIKGVNEEKFIQSIIDRSHIVVPTGFDQLRFSHMTFQEFFASEYLFADFPSNETILSWYGDDWWQEVLFFLAGRKKDITKVVDALLTSDHCDPNTRMTKLITLGSMLQSGFLTSASAKVDGVKLAAESFPACYDDLFDSIDRNASLKVKKRISRVMLMDILQEIFAANFSSIYLQQALSEVFDSLEVNQEFQASRFLLACSLAKLGNKEALLEFATDPRMLDTSMYLISQAEINSKTLKTTDKDKLNRLKKRMGTFKEAIKQEFQSPFGKKNRRLLTNRIKTN